MIPLDLGVGLKPSALSKHMILSLHIAGYRGFRKFEMGGLGRVNLLVGTNNSGKTSVLEAIELLTSGGNPMSVWKILQRRGETVTSVLPQGSPLELRPPPMEAEVCHLFNGHDVHPGSAFSLGSKNETAEPTVTVTVEEVPAPSQDDSIASPLGLALRIRSTVPLSDFLVHLGRNGGIVALQLLRTTRLAVGERPLQVVTTDSLSSQALVALWDKVALTPAENLVLRALSFVDPHIVGIATQSGRQSASFGTASRSGGFILKLKGVEQPVPIGSMGDGMWRMLAMAIAITQCRGGVLLVDEIDTGLHYTIMADMWRLILGAAKEMDVQVFATTHSFDCIQSLATVCQSDTEANDTVTLQRIEAGKSKAIPYSEREIRVAAERNIEVR